MVNILIFLGNKYHLTTATFQLMMIASEVQRASHTSHASIIQDLMLNVLLPTDAIMEETSGGTKRGSVTLKQDLNSVNFGSTPDHVIVPFITNSIWTNCCMSAAVILLLFTSFSC